MIYVFFAIIFFVLIIVLIKNNYLQLKYCLIWIVVAFSLVLVAVFPMILTFIGGFIDIKTPVNALYLIIIMSIILILLQLTIVLSRNSLRVRTLTQAIATNIMFHKLSDTLVIVPAYNEESNILTVVGDIKKHTNFDYIIINDCSVDDTKSVCVENKLNFIDLPINLGIGGAIQTGYIYAKKMNYQIAIQFDGDGQHKAEFLQDLVDMVNSGEDLVIGSRFLSKVDEGFRSTFMRRLGIRYFMLLIQVLISQKISDSTSGLRACSKNAIDFFSKSYPADYPEPESIIRIVAQRLTVKEISVTMRERQAGVSSISNIKAVYYMIKVTLAMIIARLEK